jgi:DNA polymerase-3 subunit alpha
MVYQEQVMQTAVVMAGFSMSEADTLRKVMGKKIREKVAAQREKFIGGAVANGHPERAAREIFDLIEPFADYGFNASHACAYGYVAYQTAYLMAHHAVEYMAAILTSVKDDKDRKPYYLYACRGMGIDVLPPDVNESDVDFAPAPGGRRAIRYGLSAVRNVGEGVVRSIVEARDEGGPFGSYTDFCRRVDPTALTKRVLESLIYAGAFGSLGSTRGGMLQQVGEQAAWEKVAAPILAERRAEAAGQFSLFGESGGGLQEVDVSILEGPELDKRLLLSKEKEMLGQFVTDHPLLGVEDVLRAQCSHDIRALEELGDGDLVTVGGIIGSLTRKYTKRGEPYAQFRLEGLAGGVEVVAFPSVYEAVPELMETDRIVLVSGRIDLRGRELQIRANEVREPDLGGPDLRIVAAAVVVDLPAAACTPAVLDRLRELFEAHPGAAPVRLRFLSSQGVMPLDAGTFTVDPRGSLLDEVRGLLGEAAARLEQDPDLAPV